MNKDVVKACLEKQLPIDEGVVLHVYQDSKGIGTVGIGRNLRDKGLSAEECNHLNMPYLTGEALIDALTKRAITLAEAFYLLDNDIEEVLQEVEKNISWMQSQPDVVWCVVSNMTFNIGIYGVLKFKNTLSFIEQGEYEKASVEMLNSKWHTDVGARAERLSNLLKTA